MLIFAPVLTLAGSVLQLAIKITFLGDIMEGRQLSLALYLQTPNFVF